MHRDELLKELMPLTEKEIHYRKHPESSAAVYSSIPGITVSSDGVYIFGSANPNDGERSVHGKILPSQSKTSMHPNLLITKQTRYSVIPMHKHAFIEVNYIYHGSATVVFTDYQVKLNEGDLCILDTDVVHTILPAEEKDLIFDLQLKKEYFSMYFIDALKNSGVIAGFLANAISERTEHDRFIIIPTDSEPDVKNLFEHLICEYLDPKVCSVEMLDSYIRLLFIMLARCYQQNQESIYSQSSSTFLTQILKYIEENCESCTLKGTSDIFGYNPNYLTGLIRRNTGYSFKELVNRYRLSKAEFLLSNSTISIEKISEECGWHNLNQFYKVFRLLYHETPAQYRKRKADNS